VTTRVTVVKDLSHMHTYTQTYTRTHVHTHMLMFGRT